MGRLTLFRGVVLSFQQYSNQLKAQKGVMEINHPSPNLEDPSTRPRSFVNHETARSRRLQQGMENLT